MLFIKPRISPSARKTFSKFIFSPAFRFVASRISLSLHALVPLLSAKGLHLPGAAGSLFFFLFSFGVIWWLWFFSRQVSSLCCDIFLRPAYISVLRSASSRHPPSSFFSAFLPSLFWYLSADSVRYALSSLGMFVVLLFFACSSSFTPQTNGNSYCVL